MSKRILLIVEGPNDEKVLVKKLWDRFDKNVDYTIVTYETNVYVLMRKLFKEGIVDENLDLLSPSWTAGFCVSEKNDGSSNSDIEKAS